MNFDLALPGPLLSEKHVDDFEVEVGIQLPGDYKTFIMWRNGGVPKPRIGFDFEGDVNEIGCFYELVQGSDSGLRRVLVDIQPIANDVLPIASDLGERDICLSSDNDGVLLALYEYDDEEVARAARMVHIARSFSGFLDGLIEIPESSDRIVDLGENGTAASLRSYLDEGHSIDDISKNHLTILGEAIRAGNVELVQTCIEKGADLSRAICVAVQCNLAEVIPVLIDAGANVNEVDEAGHTPLFYAVGQKRRALREALISLGAEKH